MADPKYPLSDPRNLGDNLSELFERIDIIPKDRKPGNFNGYIEEDLAISDSVGTTIYHGLNRIPIGIIPVSKSGASDIYVVSKDKDTMMVQGTAVITATILIL